MDTDFQGLMMVRGSLFFTQPLSRPPRPLSLPTPSLGKCLQNTKKFPNISKLVEFGHSKRVKMGFCETILRRGFLASR